MSAKQSRKKSLVEACVVVATGFIVSFLGGLVLYPLNGAQFSLTTNLIITAEFTILSIARVYVVRRWFNK